MPDVRLSRLADVLVNYSVRVRDGDLVKITGSSVAEPLLVELYKSALRAGGRPYVHMVSDECNDEFFRIADGAQLDFANPVAQYEIEKIDCLISLWGAANTKSLSNADPVKQARASKARRKFFTTFMSRTSIPAGKKGNLRWVGTQFPTQSAAQDAEMSLREYEDFVFGAGLLHLADPAAGWKAVSVRQERVARFLNKAREVRFRTPQGTDLTVGVKGRAWINCDGRMNFPDGEVFAGPTLPPAGFGVEGHVNYTFPAVYNGREVEGVRLKFKAGRVVEASATKNEEFLIKMLDQDAGARNLGEIAIGTNYQIQQYTKNTLFDEKIGGTFHAAVGAGYPETGNANESGLHWDMVCDLRRGGTISVDGEVISRDGRFVFEGWPGGKS